LYGDGQNVRDWLFVEDHCEAVRMCGSWPKPANLQHRRWNEKRNVDVVDTICSILDELCCDDPVLPHRTLISFVKDRPDTIAAMPWTRVRSSTNWDGNHERASKAGFAKLYWYLQNVAWVNEVTAGNYRPMDRHTLSNGLCAIELLPKVK